VTPEPEQVVRDRLARGVRQVLVHWKGQSMASATWEDLDTFRDKYPDFQLEDELDIKGGEMSCGAAPTAGAGKISNILPISNICPIGNIFPINNICPISNIFPISNICPIGNIFPIDNI
jgi:hypothetical protein